MEAVERETKEPKGPSLEPERSSREIGANLVLMAAERGLRG